MLSRFARFTLFSSLGLLALLPAASQAQNAYGVTTLVTSSTDPDLINPWGISYPATGPFWISDNGTGKTTLYNGAGTKLGLIVTIPPASGGSPPSAPTGQVFNGGSGFDGERFIFVTEDGTVSGWKGAYGTTAVRHADNSGTNAIYKGNALGSANGQDYLYATDFHNGHVDVFDSNYAPHDFGSSAFVDPNLPSGFAPYNIQNIGGKLYVAFAQQDADKKDGTIGPGTGYVDVFDTSGTLLSHLQHGDWMNQPWGIAQAPGSFGAFSGDLLVGNFGDGRINAFDPTTGAWLGFLKDGHGNPFAADGLWALTFGNGGLGGDLDKLYFTAGINDEAGGLFGSLQVVPEPGTVSTGLLIALSGGTVLLRRRKR